MDVSEKEAEIGQCKTHISELNIHAEAQAIEYKQKFKELEALAKQVKIEPPSTSTCLTSTKSEKNVVKSRGSGSPFKCIGLGLGQQINSEKDEELTAKGRRIEELEAIAASRQKEIFMLKTRLAETESMTHDVIRDLLGVKLDMTHYASILDHHPVQKIGETAQHRGEESAEKEDVAELRKQLNEFIEERQGWLDEINRRHTEMVAVRVASEELRQKYHLLSTENEMLKMDIIKYKKSVMELEDEVKKLSDQHNLQPRIHHHAKIKEENSLLKVRNEDLTARLQRVEAALTRVKEELALYRLSSGRSPYVDIDEEQRLKNKLLETEEERFQLAQKLLGLCTSVLKAAGITRSSSNVNPSMAEEALKQLKERLSSLEGELQDVKFKSKISSEKVRLSELMQHFSTPNSRKNENCPTSRSINQTRHRLDR
ncbi:hypothetical protein QJS10_CPB13g00189 [Acorus calamus]|uniref:Uncharacterized protein n=1 Tax=Acorus calamus TaxID=4465 RepID=A0AAV9DI49_ACOCL|nr:hypothetical protein QJS10_CPB13g00189 [Acorus calamus]